MANLAAVHSRILSDGGVLKLAASVGLYENTFVLYDFETKSPWFTLPGTSGLTCIGGELAGQKLDEFNAIKIRWYIWIKNNNNTCLLDP